MEIKSKLIQCPKGHYYNGALHDTCPVCQEEAVGGTRQPDFGNGTIPAGDGSLRFGGRTIPVGDQEPGRGIFSPTLAPEETGERKGAFSPTIAPDAVTPSPEVQSAAFGETVVGEELPDGCQTEPVAGWLVCIEGPQKGKDFRIFAGYNYVGRESGDILIPDDMQVSRQNHAMIAYDPDDDTYYVGPSVGRNLLRVNGKKIFSAVELKSYDVISIGATKLMLISLCGEQFNWLRGRTND